MTTFADRRSSGTWKSLVRLLHRRRRPWIVVGSAAFLLTLLSFVPRVSAATIRWGEHVARRLAWDEATTVQSLNVFGLPWPVGVDVAARCRLVAEGILASEPDLVALQEVWDEASLEPLLETGYHACCSESPQGLFGRTGLLTLTRFPILEATSRCFTVASGFDALVGKGALCTVVQLPEGERFAVWNVHLQSDASAREVRRRQIGELVHWVAEEQAERRIVMGDFNCGPGDAEWDDLVGGLARFGLLPCRCDGPTYDPEHNPLAAPDCTGTIDHVFVEEGSVGAVPAARRVYDRPREGSFVSDHFGVEVGLRYPGDGR